jgi:hypothetical protein
MQARCVICGRAFQKIARGVVCCGMALSLLVGHPPRPQPTLWDSPVRQNATEVGSSSTATASTVMASVDGSIFRSTKATA